MKHLDLILAEKLLKISATKLQPDNPFHLGIRLELTIYTDNRKTLLSRCPKLHQGRAQPHHPRKLLVMSMP